MPIVNVSPIAWHICCPQVVCRLPPANVTTWVSETLGLSSTLGPFCFDSQPAFLRVLRFFVLTVVARGKHWQDFVCGELFLCTSRMSSLLGHSR